MKQIIFLKKNWILLLFVFIWNSNLQAQYGGSSFHFISPGNNSCNAGRIFDVGWVYFPVPPGLTLAQLNYLETDFAPDSDPEIAFEIIAQSTCGLINIYIKIGPWGTPNPPWINSGNVASPSTGTYTYSFCNQAGQTIQYGDVQTLYGSSIVLSIRMLSWEQGINIDFDNTRINNTTYNYDDCDNDGLLDIYDCDLNHGGNNKVLVCHNGNTICVALSALQAHENHGDYLGSCSSFAPLPDILPPKEDNKIELKLYPNPASNQINIRNKNNKMLGTVSIYDISGKMIYNNFIGSSQAIIDVKSFSPGVYYLRSDQMEKGLKFVKQ
jgi:hypothetical protein